MVCLELLCIVIKLLEKPLGLIMYCATRLTLIGNHWDCQLYNTLLVVFIYSNNLKRK
jgi:hypothetical protein